MAAERSRDLGHRHLRFAQPTFLGAQMNEQGMGTSLRSNNFAQLSHLEIEPTR